MFAYQNADSVLYGDGGKGMGCSEATLLQTEAPLPVSDAATLALSDVASRTIVVDRPVFHRNKKQPYGTCCEVQVSQNPTYCSYGRRKRHV
jgi:hypothetical protein